MGAQLSTLGTLLKHRITTNPGDMSNNTPGCPKKSYSIESWPKHGREVELRLQLWEEKIGRALCLIASSRRVG